MVVSVLVHDDSYSLPAIRNGRFFSLEDVLSFHPGRIRDMFGGSLRCGLNVLEIPLDEIFKIILPILTVSEFVDTIINRFAGRGVIMAVEIVSHNAILGRPPDTMIEPGCAFVTAETGTRVPRVI